MPLDSIQRELDALFAPRQSAGFFARLWGLTQEPAEVQAEALAALLKQLTPPAGSEQAPLRGRALEPYFDAACRELEANLHAIRELCDARPHPPFAYITWLWRVSQVLQSLRQDGWLEALPR